MSDRKLGLVVGRNETWSFVKDLYEDWKKRYQVDVFVERSTSSPIFRERLDRHRLRNDLSDFLAENDIVFFEWGSELLALASHLPKTTPIITRIHRYEIYEWIGKVNWDAVDEIVLVSKAKYQEFTERFPAQVDKCHVIPEAVNLERFTFQPRPFSGNVGILCHLSPRKRVYELILTFHSLAQQHPDLHLYIGGAHQEQYADYYFAMTDIVRRLGLGKRVKFDGPVEDTPAWYRKIDIYISNSYSEGLQLAPMEAMASGCFTLSHWWAGAEELLPSDNLFFSELELQEKIEDYIGSSEMVKQQHIEQLRSIVEKRFDVEQTARLYKDMIDRHLP